MKSSGGSVRLVAKATDCAGWLRTWIGWQQISSSSRAAELTDAIRSAGSDAPSSRSADRQNDMECHRRRRPSLRSGCAEPDQFGRNRRQPPIRLTFTTILGGVKLADSESRRWMDKETAAARDPERVRLMNEIRETTDQHFFG